MTDAMTQWDSEYRRQGIPSSHRNEPSSVLLWALSNWRYLSKSDRPQTAIDLGCGTGRNTLYLAQHGVSAVGIDSSKVAIELADSRRADLTRTDATLRFIEGDVTGGLPFENESFQLATDIFVYFHQLKEAARKEYRSDIHRLLTPDGMLLMSLATAGDGYYATCSPIESWEVKSSIPLVLDPGAGIGNTMFTLDSLTKEMSDYFSLEMAWIKRKIGLMHGHEYERETLATLWTPKALPRDL
jgi:SAM-dependent methyltransferase